MAVTADKIFINLPVKDLNKSMAFFRAIGFDFNLQFTDDNAACLVISEHIFCMLLTEPFFKGFVNKEIVDAKRSTEVILAISAESRAEVDELVRKALDNGGYVYNDPIDHGFMYSWSFQDVDHHLWEVVFMEAMPPEQEGTQSV